MPIHNLCWVLCVGPSEGRQVCSTDSCPRVSLWALITGSVLGGPPPSKTPGSEDKSRRVLTFEGIAVGRLRRHSFKLAPFTVPADNSNQDAAIFLFAGRHSRNVFPLNYPLPSVLAGRCNKWKWKVVFAISFARRPSGICGVDLPWDSCKSSSSLYDSRPLWDGSASSSSTTPTWPNSCFHNMAWIFQAQELSLSGSDSLYYLRPQLHTQQTRSGSSETQTEEFRTLKPIKHDWLDWFV